MIYDCFTFFNELDTLEIRLHEMSPWVDRFVLVESKETFSGHPKPLWFSENRNRFEAFLPKIIYAPSPPVDASTNPWVRQAFQRNHAVEALSDCSDDDLILVGDVDEIIRGRNLTKIPLEEGTMAVFLMENFFFYYNLLRPGGWFGTVILRYETLMSPPYKGDMWEARRLRRKGGGGRVKGGGWHFSNIGGKDSVIRKLKASCHFNTDSYKQLMEDEDFLFDLMEGTREIKGKKLRVMPIDNSYPKWFKKNVHKFVNHITAR